METGLQLLLAVFFLGSGLCWLRAATFPHPKEIDLNEEHNWFWTHQRVAGWNRHAAWLACCGGAVGASAATLYAACW
jgi:hypothetical protein